MSTWDDEWRGAVAAMNEVERVHACGHLVRVHGLCIDCGDNEPKLAAHG